MQNCSDNTKRGSVQDSRQTSVGNGRRVSEQDARRESLEDKSVFVQDTRQVLAKSVRQRTAQLTKQDSVEDARQEQVETMGNITEAAANGVVQKDKEMSSALQSQIPLPVIPARNKPKDHKRRGYLCRKRQKPRYSETSIHTQEQSSDQVEAKQSSREYVKGFEGSGRETKSGTSEEADGSADGEDNVAGKEYPGQNWEELGIVTESVLEDLHDQVSGLRTAHVSLAVTLKASQTISTCFILIEIA
jgi:hypothetical protein